jgi:hypothetical protein
MIDKNLIENAIQNIIRDCWDNGTFVKIQKLYEANDIQAPSISEISETAEFVLKMASMRQSSYSSNCLKANFKIEPDNDFSLYFSFEAHLAMSTSDSIIRSMNSIKSIEEPNTARQSERLKSIIAMIQRAKDLQD